MGYLNEEWKWFPQPKFSSPVDESKYREREVYRWINGYEGLSGIHYFYLAEGTILSGQYGLIRPV